VLLFSIVYWTFFCITLVLLFVPALVLFLVTAPFDRRRVAIHYFTSAWAHFYIATNPLWSVRVIGAGKLPRRGAAIYVANHSSLIDILVVFLVYRPFKWVSKKEVFNFPIIGWLMRMNAYIPIERGRRESVVKLMQACERQLALGIPVLFFPEGTRSPRGELQQFKDGAFQLAKKVGVPVYPIVIEGTAATLPKHGLVLKSGMKARVEVLDPLDPGHYESVAKLRDEVRARIEQALAAASVPEAT
jgi:1-acyl-sn-glycerol-3-phosphate acyltransferase